MTASADFDLQVKESDDRVSIVVSGDLDLASADAIVRALEAIASMSAVVVDLAGVGFMDSSGLRALLRSRDLASGKGASFALRGCPEPVTKVLAIAGVHDWFDYE